MLSKSKAALLDLFLKLEDFVIATAFRVWLWLGAELDVRIQVPVQVVYKDRPETQETLVRLANSNAELIAGRDEVKALNLAYMTAISELQAEREELQSKLAKLAPTKGENRANARKLTAREVMDIRYYHRAGWTNKSIADTYDVNPATISRIVRGLYYKTLQAA